MLRNDRGHLWNSSHKPKVLILSQETVRQKKKASRRTTWSIIAHVRNGFAKARKRLQQGTNRTGQFLFGSFPRARPVTQTTCHPPGNPLLQTSRYRWGRRWGVTQVRPVRGRTCLHSWKYSLHHTDAARVCLHSISSNTIRTVITECINHARLCTSVTSLTPKTSCHFFLERVFVIHHNGITDLCSNHRTRRECSRRLPPWCKRVWSSLQRWLSGRCRAMLTLRRRGRNNMRSSRKPTIKLKTPVQIGLAHQIIAFLRWGRLGWVMFSETRKFYANRSGSNKRRDRWHCLAWRIFALASYLLCAARCHVKTVFRNAGQSQILEHSMKLEASPAYCSVKRMATSGTPPRVVP